MYIPVQPGWSIYPATKVESHEKEAQVERCFCNEINKIDLVGSTVLLVPFYICLLYTSPSPRDRQKSRMPSSA